MKDYLQLMRPHQYIKNLALFLPAFFALRITDPILLGKTILAAVAFSLAASSVYILNDYRDREDDRLHPVKKNRPLAAGTVSVQNAWILMGVLLLSSLTVLGIMNQTAFFLLVAYLSLNVAYSFGLKHIPIIDIFIIAIGFVIRIAVGAEVGDIPLSMWIILITFLLALFIALAKRRDDVILAAEGKKVRKSIDGYNLEFINGAMMMIGAVMMVAYISYTISPEIQNKFNNQSLYLTAFFVLLGVLRYLQITFVEQKSGHPARILLSDIFLQLTVLAWLATFGVLLYF